MRLPSRIAPVLLCGALLAAAPDTGDPDPRYGALAVPLDLLDIPEVHDLGFRGEGLRVGILGAAFRTDHPTLTGIRLAGTRDFVEGDGSVEPDPADDPVLVGRSSGLLALLAADAPETLIGAVPEADFYLARVLAGASRVREDEERWVEALEWMRVQGVDVVLSAVDFRTFETFSYDTEDLDGATALSTVAAASAASGGVVVVAPTGDRGPGPTSLGAPADGNEVLAVGAWDGAGGATDFSGRGPTADGRSKPDLLAPGVEVATAAVATGGIGQITGTDAAAALIAGSAALFLQVRSTATPAEVRTALVAAADRRLREAGAEGLPSVGSAVVFPQGVVLEPVAEVSPARRLTSLVPTFRWNTPDRLFAAGAAEFRVQLAPDSTFSNVLDEFAAGRETSFRPTGPLRPETRFHWRVVASTPGGVVRASGPSEPIEVPAWVQLRNLDDPAGSSVDNPRPEFRWEAFDLPASVGPFRFDLEILDRRTREVVARYPELGRTIFRVPAPLPINIPLLWRVIARASDESADTVSSSGPFVVTSAERPPATVLYQNFPNPFPQQAGSEVRTEIWFDLAERSEVSLGLFDLRGRRVRRLIPADGCAPVELEAGEYGRELLADPCVVLEWDGRDDTGARVPPGVYLLRLRAGGVEQIKRVLFTP